MKRISKQKRVITLSIATALFVGMLTGCENYELNQWYDKDSKIGKDTDSYAMENSIRNVEEGIYVGETTLTGTLSVWEYTAEADEILEVPYELTVSNGSAKLVHISEDKTVTTLLEKTEKGSELAPKGTVKISLKKGLNRLKMVGRHKATYSIKLNIQKGQFLTD